MRVFWLLCAFFAAVLADPIGGRVIYASSGRFDGLDPAFARSRASLCAISQSFEGLMRFSDKGIKLALASSVDISDNGRIYTFKLRDDVVFSNGDLLSSKDVSTSLERVGRLKWLIKDIIAIDNNTVQITLNWSFAPFLNYLAMPYASILSHKSFAANGELLSPIGTGPFIITSSDNTFAELVANERYLPTPPRIAALNILSVPKYKDRAQMLKLQNAHIASLPFTQKLNSASRMQNFSSFSTLVLVFNPQNRALSQLEVRKALFAGLNRSALQSPDTMQAESVFAPGMLGFSYSHKSEEYDFLSAKKILQESGLIKPFTLELAIVAGGPVRSLWARQIAEKIAAQYEQLGILLSIKELSNEQLENDAQADLLLLDFASEHADSDDVMQLVLEYDPRKEPDLPLEKLVRNARFSVENTERAQYYEAAQQLLDAAYIWQPIAHKKRFLGMLNYIADAELSALEHGCVEFSKVYFKHSH